jgi:hypothetical protein
MSSQVVPYLRQSVTVEARIQLRAVYEGFVVGKVALGQVFQEYFGYRLSVISTKLHVRLSSRECTEGPLEDAVPRILFLLFNLHIGKVKICLC